MEVSEGVLLAARIVVGGAFLIIGIRNVGNIKLIAGMVKANRFPMATLLTSMGVGMQIAFGALMAVGLFPIISAVGLLVFTVVATLMAHSFWMFRDKAERTQQINMFLGNMIMAGGLLALVAAAL